MPTVEDIINIGFSNHQNGKLSEAEYAYQEVLRLDCENAEVCNLLGVLKLQQNDVDSAIDWVEKAINRMPCEYFYETLFQAYIRSKKYNKIIECEKIILEKYSESFSLLFNLALAYKNLNQNKLAIKFYDKALSIDPSSYDAWFNLSHLYKIEKDYTSAISALKICNKLKPNNPETEYFLSLVLMQTKDYKKGLKLFENRISKESAISIFNKTYPNLATRDNLWQGENIKNKTILVYYEAGFGDTIMFARYLPLLKKKCKKIIFYPQKQLAELFAQSNLGIDEIVEGFIPEQNLKFDVHTPIMSLPYLLGLKGEEVFALSEGFLNADIELAEQYKQEKFNNNEIKIGIKWQGNTYYDEDRVIPTEAFLPLMEIENTRYYSFQTFEGSQDISKLTSKFEIVDIGKDLIDFSQTAAALVNLDLVICNDTSLAHLAGALGIPCIMLLPYDINWRWHNDLSKCDWYDSIKLFGQKSQGDWNEVIDEVKEFLQDSINKN
ncbi:tetratricopeptide repeat protein [bacterium]|nr:tetratricopeptide repeat protein [bacterium]